MKKLVVLTGAGISAESGIATFRGMGGLWEKHDITEIASPQGWKKNPELVQNFYNERRKRMLECVPNAGHYGLAKLEQYFDVEIITQNVDDLHERAGSSKILHIHGELRKSRSTLDPKLVYDVKGWEIKMGDKCERGSQLRPHIVWFGEAVPLFDIAVRMVENADIFVVVGTALQVYPAASLLHYAKNDIPVYIVDPNEVSANESVTFIKKPATEGVPELIDILLKKFS